MSRTQRSCSRSRSCRPASSAWQRSTARTPIRPMGGGWEIGCAPHAVGRDRLRLGRAAGYLRGQRNDEQRVESGADTLRWLFGGQRTLIPTDELAVYLRKVQHDRTGQQQLTAFLQPLFTAGETSSNVTGCSSRSTNRWSRASQTYTETSGATTEKTCLRKPRGQRLSGVRHQLPSASGVSGHSDRQDRDALELAAGSRHAAAAGSDHIESVEPQVQRYDDQSCASYRSRKQGNTSRARDEARTEGLGAGDQARRDGRNIRVQGTRGANRFGPLCRTLTVHRVCRSYDPRPLHRVQSRRERRRVLEPVRGPAKQGA